ncbi:MAG: xanthine dehydrogenase family protein molybdopterin-binding subunit [Chloroflexota bacterium]
MGTSIRDAFQWHEPPSARRTDGVEKVTGSAVFAADVRRPGQLVGKILRSPIPHARIVRIDASRAAELPGVRAVLTAHDLPAFRIGRSIRDMPILATEKVRFIGEKVAAVAADTTEIAEEALSLIEVDYHELAAVYNPLEAIRENAPLIHDPALIRAWKTPSQVVADYPNSVSNPVWGSSRDEVEQSFQNCAHVFEHTFHTPRQHQGYLEPHSALVEIDPAGTAHIWASNKAPFLLFNYLKDSIGLTREQIEFHMLPLGGDFGGKGSFMDIPLAYFLAQRTGRPVKITMTYAEELTAGNPRHACTIVVKSGFDTAGHMQARYTRAYFNSGAYAAFKPAPDATLPNIRDGGMGSYVPPIWRVEGHMIYTNTVPCGHMRAPGDAQPYHAQECHMDLCARAMGIDPLELRLRNATHGRRDRFKGGSGSGSPPRASEVLTMAAEAIGWDKPRVDGVGRGIALVGIGNSVGVYSAEIIVERKGTIILNTPMMENGAGQLTAFLQLTAEAFGVPLEQVRVEQSLKNIEFDRGLGGSRITRMTGKIVSILHRTLAQRLTDLLAGELGIPADAILTEPGGFRSPDGRLFTIAETAALSPTDLTEVLKYEGADEDKVEAFAAQAAEVQLDFETGEVTVLRAITAHELGRVINPVLHQGQIEGALIQGLGYALTEGLVLDGGRVLNAGLHEYKLPSIADIPPLETYKLPPDLSLGITPIGEGANCGMSAAIVNAVIDVVRAQVEIPLSPEAVREILADPSQNIIATEPF